MSCSCYGESVCFFPHNNSSIFFLTHSGYWSITGRGCCSLQLAVRHTETLHIMLWGQGSLALLTVSVAYTFQLGGNQHAIMTRNCWNDLWTAFYLVNPRGQLDWRNDRRMSWARLMINKNNYHTYYLINNVSWFAINPSQNTYFRKKPVAWLAFMHPHLVSGICVKGT